VGPFTLSFVVPGRRGVAITIYVVKRKRGLVALPYLTYEFLYWVMGLLLSAEVVVHFIHQGRGISICNRTGGGVLFTTENNPCSMTCRSWVLIAIRGQGKRRELRVESPLFYLSLGILPGAEK